MRKIILLIIMGICLINWFNFVSAARLPTVGGDEDTWGTILNNYLNVSLNESGGIRPANLSFAQKITFAFGEIIDNLVDGWITITGGLNITKDLEVNGSIIVNQNITANYYCDAGGCYNLTDSNSTWSSTYNATYHGLINNASYLSTYNETYDSYSYNQTEGGDSRFLNLSGTNANQNINIGDYNITAQDLNITNEIYIKDKKVYDWLYNMTIGGGDYNYNETLVIEGDYGQWFYNMTIGGGGGFSASDFQASFNLNISDWEYNYNQTFPAISFVNSAISNNMTIDFLQELLNSTNIYSTYNATYEAFNDTANIQGLLNSTNIYSTYNETYHGLINNASYLSTYNATYDSYSYNQTEGGDSRFLNLSGTNANQWGF